MLAGGLVVMPGMTLRIKFNHCKRNIDEKPIRKYSKLKKAIKTMHIDLLGSN